MSAPPMPARRVNLRTPDVMAAVQAQVERHYRSDLVEQVRAEGGRLRSGLTSVWLAKEFGFCYGVERAIDMAYAARKVFPDRRIHLLGEIIHNPDVNAQMAALGIERLPARPDAAALAALQADDIVIVPAFGSEVATVEAVRQAGCEIVDTTCGDVMSVWKRVRQNAKDHATSIIHGKATHEETRATASRALGPDGSGHFLIVLDAAEAGLVCGFIRHGGDAAAFLERFEGAVSPGFDPARHLERVGVANQTTMLRGETESIQRMVREAVVARDGHDRNFRFFDTICGATQERQDALEALLVEPLDLLLVIGGYNSSNTTHLVEIGEQRLPAYFIRNAACLESADAIRHFDLRAKREVVTRPWLPAHGEALAVGVTAGASCPNNLIEEAIRRLFELRGEAFG